MFATATPARVAMAMPSPVLTAGFVVLGNRCPAPPHASTVDVATNSLVTPRFADDEHPRKHRLTVPRLQQLHGEVILVKLNSRMRPGRLEERALDLFSRHVVRVQIEAMTAVPASLAKCKLPSIASRVNRVPRSMSVSTADFESSTITRTARSSHR